MSKPTKINLLHILVPLGIIMSVASTAIYFKAVAMAPALDGPKGILEALGTWLAFGSWLLFALILVIVIIKRGRS